MPRRTLSILLVFAWATAALAMPLLSCSLYSGTSATRDPCCRGLAYVYNFGPSYGDSVTGTCDDCSNLVSFPVGRSFSFFGVSYASVYLNSNGLLSFGAQNTVYTSQAFPISVCEHRDPPLPRSWVDVDTRGSVATVAGYPTTNRIWYRSPATPLTADVQRMTADVAASFRELCQEGRVTCIVAVQHLDTAAASSPAFVPTFVSVFTWFAVGRYNSGADLLNTFQVVLASDASGVSYVTFCFDNLLYDSGSASAGTHVNVGFNAGSGNVYYSLPGANTASDLAFSCGGANGCFTFRVDTTTIILPSPSPTPSSTSSTSPSRTLTQSSTRTSSQGASRSGSGTTTQSLSGSQATSTSLSASTSATTSQRTTASPSGSATSTFSATPSLTPSQGGSASGTGSCTRSQVLSPSGTLTPSTTATRSPTRSPTLTVSVTPTATPSARETRTVTPSITGTRSGSQTGTASRTGSSSMSITMTVTPTSSASSTVTLSITPSGSQAKTGSASSTQSRSASQGPTASSSETLSLTATRTPTRSPSLTTTTTRSSTGSATGAASVSPTRTPSRTPTPSESQARTLSRSQTGTSSLTASSSSTPSGSPSMSTSASASASATTSSSQSISIGASASSTASQRRSETRSRSSSASASNRGTPSSSASSSFSGTASSPGTASHSSSPSSSASASVASTPSASASSSHSSTMSSTPTPSDSSTPTASSSASSSGTPSQSATLSVGGTSSSTSSPSISGTSSTSSSPSLSSSPSETTSPSLSRTSSLSSTASGTATSSTTSSMSTTVSASSTPSGSASRSTTESQSATVPGTSSSLTETASPTASASQSGSGTQASTGSGSATRSAALTPSVTGSVFPTPSQSSTSSGTTSPSQGRSPSATITPSCSPSKSRSGSLSQLRSPIASRSPSATSSRKTASRSRSATSTTTRSQAVSPSSSRTLTRSQAPSGTQEESPSSSASASSSASPSLSSTASQSASLSASVTQSTSERSSSQTRTVAVSAAGATGSQSRPVRPSSTSTPTRRAPTPSRSATALRPSVSQSRTRSASSSSSIVPSAAGLSASASSSSTPASSAVCSNATCAGGASADNQGAGTTVAQFVDSGGFIGLVVAAAMCLCCVCCVIAFCACRRRRRGKGESEKSTAAEADCNDDPRDADTPPLSGPSSARYAVHVAATAPPLPLEAGVTVNVFVAAHSGGNTERRDDASASDAWDTEATGAVALGGNVALLQQPLSQRMHRSEKQDYADAGGHASTLEGNALPSSEDVGYAPPAVAFCSEQEGSEVAAILPSPSVIAANGQSLDAAGPPRLVLGSAPSGILSPPVARARVASPILVRSSRVSFQSPHPPPARVVEETVAVGATSPGGDEPLAATVPVALVPRIQLTRLPTPLDASSSIAAPPEPSPPRSAPRGVTLPLTARPASRPGGISLTVVRSVRSRAAQRGPASGRSGAAVGTSRPLGQAQRGSNVPSVESEAATGPVVEEIESPGGGGSGLLQRGATASVGSLDEDIDAEGLESHSPHYTGTTGGGALDVLSLPPPASNSIFSALESLFQETTPRDSRGGSADVGILPAPTPSSAAADVVALTTVASMADSSPGQSFPSVHVARQTEPPGTVRAVVRLASRPRLVFPTNPVGLALDTGIEGVASMVASRANSGPARALTPLSRGNGAADGSDSTGGVVRSNLRSNMEASILETPEQPSHPLHRSPNAGDSRDDGAATWVASSDAGAQSDDVAPRSALEDGLLRLFLDSPRGGGAATSSTASSIGPFSSAETLAAAGFVQPMFGAASLPLSPSKEPTRESAPRRVAEAWADPPFGVSPEPGHLRRGCAASLSQMAAQPPAASAASDRATLMQAPMHAGLDWASGRAEAEAEGTAPRLPGRISDAGRGLSRSLTVGPRGPAWELMQHPAASEAEAPPPRRISHIRQWLAGSAQDARHFDGSASLPALLRPPPPRVLAGPPPAWATVARGPLARRRPPGGRGSQSWIEQLRDRRGPEKEADDSSAPDPVGDWWAQQKPQLQRQQREAPEGVEVPAGPRFMQPTQSRLRLLQLPPPQEQLPELLSRRRRIAE